MAEFVDVLRQFARMCKANAGCFNCPLHKPDSVSDECSVNAFVKDSERIEREVMKWAAEHPVVYPTWSEWLYEQGVLKDQAIPMPTINDDSSCIVAKNVATEKVDQQIPADIAQKLEIEPKEG